MTPPPPAREFTAASSCRRPTSWSTASDLVFAGGREGHFYALDAKTGAVLWQAMIGGQIASGPITYAVNGKQYVTVSAGSAMFAFALRP